MSEREPTLEEVERAVRSLPRAMLERLALGPLPDPDDCRICDDVLEPWLYGVGPDARWEGDPEVDEHARYVEGPHDEAALLLIDWHRWWGDPDFHAGRGEEAYRRCQAIYEAARACVRPAAAS